MVLQLLRLGVSLTPKVYTDMSKEVGKKGKGKEGKRKGKGKGKGNRKGKGKIFVSQ